MSTWIFRAAPIIAAIIFLVGCTSAPGSVALVAAAKPEKQDITVAAIPASDLAGLYVALNRGLFAEQGLHVTIKKIPSSQAVIAAQLNARSTSARAATSPISRHRRPEPGSAFSPRPPRCGRTRAHWLRR